MDFSVEKVKKNIKWLVCAFLGLFHFVWLAFPFISGAYGLVSVSGYKTMDGTFVKMDAGFLMVFFQGFALAAALVMLAASGFIIAKEFFGVDIPDNMLPFNMKTVCNFALPIYAALNIAVFISIIILCLANDLGALSVGLGFGTVMVALISAVVAGIFIYMEKKGMQIFAQDSAKYVCSKCGAASKAGNSFCVSCGGTIVKVEPQPKAPKLEYVCSKCNEKYKKEVAFCSKCGGKVEGQAPAVWCCEQCGELSKEGYSFCGKCGGKIIKK